MTGQLDHSRRDVTAQNSDSLFGQVQCIDTGAAIDFEDALPRGEDSFKLPPHSFALCSADKRVWKDLVVIFGRNIPVALS